MYTITVERSAGEDRHGNALPAATHTIDNCWDAPAGSTEDHHQESTVEWDLDLFVQAGADIVDQDVVLLPGDTTRYQVFGRPAKWRAPTNWEPGIVVRLKGVS